MRAPVSGYTLIECMIGLAITAILCALALPNFTTTIQDSQIRATAQSLLSGLQMARAEAIRRNTLVEVYFPNASGGIVNTNGGTDWLLRYDLETGPAPVWADIVKRTFKETSSSVVMGISRRGAVAPPPAGATGPAIARAAMPQAPSEIIFNSVGRLGQATNTVEHIDIYSQTNLSARQLRILISQGGQLRLCDPMYPLAENPLGC